MIDPPPEEEDEEQPSPPSGRIGPTGPGPLVAFGMVGLVAGWAIRTIALRMDRPEPQVSFTAIGLLVFLAAIVAGAAYLTRRTVQTRRGDLLPHQAVNRLALGKACALGGALVAGGYFGYALAQLGVDDPQAVSRLWRSVGAGVAGLMLVGAALALEQACRVPRDDG
jgi:hypothetical protein